MSASKRIYWPQNDHLFGGGVIELNQSVMREDLTFINLNESTLSLFLRAIPLSDDRKYVIICSRRLMSIAKYLLKRYQNVFAVFESSIKMEIISRIITTSPQNEKILETHSEQPPLTEHEFLILRLMSNGMDTRSIALLYNLKPPVIYSFEEKLYKKLVFEQSGIPLAPSLLSRLRPSQQNAR
ncbi:hypothetical protein SAMN05216516_102197 [Izhakiella capsodis]|uniref:Uncharacterized protein n=1 Tax=Izhakiella capsodis TaxID=1367852 RepID=A0A1I4W151_9GAMM|nr:hypothetical protein [Izhakiella capsodis]SFN06966.1 hypothetical protein SAMN05216516_102197 [Izhakiella capsodis]